MRCLKCEGKLSVKSVGGVEVDQCGLCSGVWFDNGELRAVLKSSIDALRNERANNVGHDAMRATCPRCLGQGKLLPIVSLDEQELHIDTCSSCFGVWLDGGELERLKEPRSVWQRIVAAFSTSVAD